MNPANPVRLVVIVSVVLLVLGYFPFLLATQYLYPLGIHEWDWISHFSGATSDLSFFETQLHWYQNTGGRYFSTALLSTLPYWYDLTAFRVIALICLLAFPMSLSWLLRTIGLQKFTWVFGAGLWLLFLDQITNCYDSLLRFTCMPIYQVGTMGVFIYVGLMYRWYHNHFQHIGLAIALAIIGWLTIGTNEISMIHILLATIIPCLLFYGHHQKIPLRVGILLPFLALGVILALNAPGNYARMELYTQAPSIVKSIGLTIAVSSYLWIDWLTNSLLLPVSILWVGLYYLYFSNINISLFSKPKYWLLLMLCLAPISIFPLLYATAGTSLPERVVDLLFLEEATLFGGWLISLSNTMIRRGNETPHEMINTSLVKKAGTVLMLFVVSNLFFGGIALDRNPQHRSQKYTDLLEIKANIGHAYLQFFTGIPQKYSLEMQHMEAIIKRSTASICYVPNLEHTDFIGYDPLYDRLNSRGEKGISIFLKNSQVNTVRYIKH